MCGGRGVCAGDKTIKMWSLAQGGTCIRTFAGHQGSVLRASFLTAGTQVRARQWGWNSLATSATTHTILLPSSSPSSSFAHGVHA